MSCAKKTIFGAPKIAIGDFFYLFTHATKEKKLTKFYERT
jgi:hypothetical protein